MPTKGKLSYIRRPLSLYRVTLAGARNFECTPPLGIFKTSFEWVLTTRDVYAKARAAYEVRSVHRPGDTSVNCPRVFICCRRYRGKCLASET